MDVLVVSEQATLRDTLSAVTREAFPDAAVHAEKSLAGAMAAVRRAKRVDLILLDLAVSDTVGIDALKRFREEYPRCRIVVFCSAAEDRGLILSALHAGAAGYLSKACSREVRVLAVRLVAAGVPYLPPELLPRQIRVPVTARQRDVLRPLVRGYSNERIAAELSISVSTVKQHARAVFAALGVSNRTQLIAAAARRGIHTDIH